MSALTNVFTDIANAIRAKKGVSTTYKPSEMAAAINSLEDYMIVKKDIEVENTSEYNHNTGGGSITSGPRTVTYSGKTLTFIGALDPIVSLSNTIGSGSLTQENFQKNFSIWIRTVVSGNQVTVYRQTSNNTGVTLNNIKIVVPLLYADIPTFS